MAFVGLCERATARVSVCVCVCVCLFVWACARSHTRADGSDTAVAEQDHRKTCPSLPPWHAHHRPRVSTIGYATRDEPPRHVHVGRIGDGVAARSGFPGLDGTQTSTPSWIHECHVGQEDRAICSYIPSDSRG